MYVYYLSDSKENKCKISEAVFPQENENKPGEDHLYEPELDPIRHKIRCPRS